MVTATLLSSHRALAPSILTLGSQSRVQNAPVRGAVRVYAQKKGFEADPALPAFTRRRERIVGRIATLGFGAGLIGEFLSGKGPISQLHFETGIPQQWLYFGMLLIIAAMTFGAAIPGVSPGPTYDPRNQRDVRKRRDANPKEEPKKFVAQSEILLGRLGMAGFLGASILEYIYNGDAPLARLGLITPGGQPPIWLFALAATFLLNGLGFFSAIGQVDEESL